LEIVILNVALPANITRIEALFQSPHNVGVQVVTKMGYQASLDNLTIHRNSCLKFFQIFEQRLVNLLAESFK
jgi:hypothetical protein